MKTYLAVKLALLPFAAFGVLLGLGQPGAAIAAGLLLALAGNLWRARQRRLFVLELAGLVLFAGLAVAHLLAAAAVASQAGWIALAWLGVVALAALGFGHPWTAAYARAAYADAAATPQFTAVNMAISGLWGALFLALAACRFAGAPGWLTWSLVGFGALASIAGPRLAIRVVLGRMRAAQESYRWPARRLVHDPAAACDVAVVGAGIGGLSAAALLADAGLRVTVFDQHVVPGGYCHSFLRKARWNGAPVLYRFDAGPHDFSGVWPGGPVDGLLRRLGVADRLQWERVDHCYRTDDGDVTVPRDWRAYAAQLGARFPDSAAGIAALFETVHAIFAGMYATGHGRSGIPGMPASTAALLAFPRDHPAAAHWMARPFDELVAAHVGDPRAVRLINALAGYLGDGSERLTCAQMAPIFGYYFKGGYYPRGGSGRLAEVLAEAITARGGMVRLKSPVRRILVEHGRAAGVELADGRAVRAQAVVSNADMRRTFLELVAPQHLPADFRARIAAAAPSNSAFAVHLGIDCVPDIQPALHLHAPMPLGIAMMSRLDPTAAPPGHATLALLTLLPHAQARTWFPETGAEDWRDLRRSNGYLAAKAALGDRMVAAAATAIPDLARHIVYRTDASPVTYARYDRASAGAIYGIAREGRLKGAKSPVPGLVIAGGGNVGAGVEAVLISGAMAAEALQPGVLASAA